MHGSTAAESQGLAICIYITTLTAEGRHEVFMSCDINPNSVAVLACKFSSYYCPAVLHSDLLLTERLPPLGSKNVQ